jgi:two-component system sensor histidine kinase TctE
VSIGNSRFNSDTLRRKLLKWVLVPMVILLLLNIALVYKFGHDSANRRHDRYLYDTSKILLDQLRTNNEGVVEFNMHNGALNMLFEDTKDITYFALKGWQQDYQFGQQNLPMPPAQISETPVYYLAEYLGHPVRMMAAILPEQDVPSKRVVVVIGKTLALHHERAQEWMWRVLPAQMLLIIFTGVMVWWGVGRGLQPLLRLHDEVNSRSQQDLSPLPEQEIVAEIRPLIHAFNQLMARLEESFEIQRRFIADAAHQLRTPLSGLKTQVDLALSIDDPEEIRHSLKQMRTAADHAARLANQLLLLARAEPGAQNPANMTQLNLAELTRNITEYWALNALQKKIDLGFEAVGSDFCIKGNALLLGEMLNNLIDNALRYTQSGGRVTVRLERIEAGVILEVEDNGPGIPQAEREQVFERFYRILGTDQEGCGLGLPIVREIALRHGGEITLSSGAEGWGTLMRVTFPLVQN